MRLPPIFPLAVAHAVCDLSQGGLPVLLPYLMAQHHISYTAAATIVFAGNTVSTVIQPVFGHIADRRSRSWMIPLGVLMAGLGFACAGIAPTYGMVVLLAALSGLGVATFHPEGARQAHHMAGKKKATVMSLFTFGGQLGFAIGPLAATAALLAHGLRGTLWFAVPAVAVAAFLFARLTQPSAVEEDKRVDPTSTSQSSGTDAWAAFFCLAAAVVSRSTIFYGLNTFVPLVWANVLHQSRATSATALTVLAVGGIIGNLLGGRIGDRFGYRKSAIVEFAILACLLPILAFTGSAIWATLLLVPIGLLLSAPSSSMVVLGQSYLPNHIGLSSGVTMGLAFSFGGMMTPVLGWIADHHGLHMTISAVALLPTVCTALMLALPRAEHASGT